MDADELVAAEATLQHRRETAKLWRLRNMERVKAYRRAYHAAHRDAQNANTKRWHKRNPTKVAEYRRKKREEDWPIRVRLHDLLGRLRHADQRLKRECTIDDDYLVALWHAQQECCAVTGLRMTLRSRLPHSVSIDRINNEHGHVPGNVHLTCKFVNLGRQANTLEECLGFFQAFRDLVLVQHYPQSSSSS